MKKQNFFRKFFSYLLVCTVTLIGFAAQDKVLQLFKNGKVIMEYNLAGVDYIEINDVTMAPINVNVKVNEKSITISWEDVPDAEYILYRSADNVKFDVLASDISTNSYEDNNPLQGVNYYKIKACVNGSESEFSPVGIGVWSNKSNDNNCGFFVGINGFNNELYTFPIQYLSRETKSKYNQFINGLTTIAGTRLYNAVDKSIDDLQNAVLPDNLSDVAIITFTDGLDQGSLNWNDKYLSLSEYLSALNGRLETETVSGQKISAYSIGVCGTDAQHNIASFKNNLQKLASSPDNVFEVNDMSEVNEAFMNIANQLSETRYLQTFSFKIAGPSHREKCRFTFDNVSNYGASKQYIEGTFDRITKCLVDVKYVGLTSTSGAVVQSRFIDETRFYEFTFEGLQSLDGELISGENVKHWYTEEGVWNHNTEFNFTPNDIRLEKIERSAAIILNLDCSSSLDENDFQSLQESAKSFIKKLVDSTLGLSENQESSDFLDFEYLPTEKEVESSIATCQDYLDQMITAMYYVVGGKDGALPQEHQWEYIYALSTDNYCGYHCLVNSKFMQGIINNTYAYERVYSEGPYSRFLSMKNYLGDMLNVDEANNIVEIKAIALLLFNIVAQENTDIYGAIPYVNHKGNKSGNPYTFNSGAEIYYSIIKNLDDIIAVFENYNNRPQWYKDKIQELLYWTDMLSSTKSIDEWKRCAASIKLRMAMHLVKYNPEDAKRFAEEAVATGVVSTLDQQIGVGQFSGLSAMHPLKVIFNDWNTSRMNASFISILKSLNHPYLEYLIAKNSNQLISERTGAIMAAGTDIVGVRAGIMMEPSQQYFSNMRVAYSQPNMMCEDFLFAPEYVVKLAEIEFLRAEGALRGWNMGGTAEYFYNQGIRHADMSDPRSFSENYSSRVDDYMAQTSATPYTYVDPMDDLNNIESVTKIGVKWDNSDDNETKLEKIITQKYIAIYPNSYEAWTEMRRTGYPKIFPVLNPTVDNDGSLAFGDLIRRMRLPHGGLEAGKADITNSGLKALGGPDVIATRVFWDIEKPNF